MTDLLDCAPLLTPARMAVCDAATIAGGTSGIELMDRAGWGLAGQALLSHPATGIVVLCGPGNNGGDGWVAARILARRGRSVRLVSLVERTQLTGDAARAAGRWTGPVETPETFLLSPPERPPLTIDALFGAGLDRPIEGMGAALVQWVNGAGGRVIAADLPSGVNGATGQLPGPAVTAELTVTFAAAKPGHVLEPGADHCGRVIVHDIGITPETLRAASPAAWLNGPERWRRLLPARTNAGHKYNCGHIVILGGGEMTGAARLAAEAARCCGAGLVTIVAPDKASAQIYRASSPGILVEGAAGWDDLLARATVSAILVGPGMGGAELQLARAERALRSGKPVIVDADALTHFARAPERLFSAIHGNGLMTPHEGEFARLFGPPVTGASKIDRTVAAARRAGCPILLKGRDTVIAEPGEGAAVVNRHASAALATGGSGDVLAGIAAALCGGGMSAFAAAQAAAWIHGEAALRLGAGLIAEDLPRAAGTALAGLRPGLWQRGAG